MEIVITVIVCVDLLVVDLVAWILLSGHCRVDFVNVALVAWVV